MKEQIATKLKERQEIKKIKKIYLNTSFPRLIEKNFHNVCLY